MLLVKADAEMWISRNMRKNISANVEKCNDLIHRRLSTLAVFMPALLLQVAAVPFAGFDDAHRLAFEQAPEVHRVT